jgi:hypothetical protein
LEEDGGASRRRNWLAAGLGAPIAAVSHLALTAATVDTAPGDAATLVVVGLVTAPAAACVIVLVSGGPGLLTRLLEAVVLMPAVALPLGLFMPSLGVAAGLGAGAAVGLRRPRSAHVLRHRLVALVAAVLYAAVVLAVSAPAGVLSAALLPVVSIVLGDEFSVWQDLRRSG